MIEVPDAYKDDTETYKALCAGVPLEDIVAGRRK